MARDRAVVAGREIGSYDGWDEIDSYSFILYDFTPEVGIDLPSGPLTVAYESGLFLQTKADDDDEVKETFRVDMIDILSKIDRTEN